MESLQPMTVAAEQLHVRALAASDGQEHLDAVFPLPLGVPATVHMVEVEHADVIDATASATPSESGKSFITGLRETFAPPVALVGAYVVGIPGEPVFSPRSSGGRVLVGHGFTLPSPLYTRKGLRKSTTVEELMSGLST